MADKPGDLILTLLRAIHGDIAGLKADVLEIKERVGFLEGQYASVPRRVGRIGDNVTLIKTRLNLVEA